MDYSTGILLLLIGAFSSNLPEIQARPNDFWCNYQVRRKMEERAEELKKEMVDCAGSDTLPSPVQLPSVLIHAAEWANKTLLQKHVEVAGALTVFQQVLLVARTQSTLQCQISLIQKVEHQIMHYLLIVNRVGIQSDAVTPQLETQDSQSSLSTVLDQYGKLLRGKLERLAVDLQESICKA